MRKYRIISEPTILEPENPYFRWYQAQYKLFNLFWVNCIPDIWPDSNRPGLSRSLDLEDVKRFVEACINNEHIDLSSKVVKVYE
jgi:hypothetical protein